MALPTQGKDQNFSTRINPLTRAYSWVESVCRPGGDFAAQLNRLNAQPSSLQHGVPCIAVMKNERLRIADFLSHYRNLGVCGFVLIDNGSTDGALEYALDQPDCVVFQTTKSYSASGFGSQWINASVDLCGLRNRWIAVADIDELLVYDDCEKRNLPDLADLLTKAGLSALPCLMLDMYDDDGSNSCHYSPGDRMVDASPMFDATGYCRKPSFVKSLRPATALAIEGGPRARVLFDQSDPTSMLPYLHKVPFMKWTPGAGMKTSHEVDPVIRNISDLRGALLHFKFLNHPDLTNKDRLRELDHWNENKQHSRYLDKLVDTAGKMFMFEGSSRYASSQSLVHHALISKLNWET